MKLADWSIFQPCCDIRYHTSMNIVSSLFEIFQGNVQIDFENQHGYDALLCYKGLTQNNSLGVHRAK